MTTKTDAEIAHDVYMRLKGETPREREFRKLFRKFGTVKMDFGSVTDFAAVSVQTHDYKAQPHDDRLDAITYAYGAPQLTGKRAYGIILDDISVA